MQRYANLSRDSGVVAFEIEPDAIVVKFLEGAEYRYSYAKPGKAHVEEMKRRAIAGRGLSGYISTHVRGNYAEKLR